jgi:hypothetical protein
MNIAGLNPVSHQKQHMITILVNHLSSTHEIKIDTVTTLHIKIYIPKHAYYFKTWLDILKTHTLSIKLTTNHNRWTINIKVQI